MMSNNSVTTASSEVAVTEAWYVPALPVGGVTVIVVLTEVTPEPGGFSVANDGSEAVKVIEAPGTPDALTGTEIDAPPATVASSIGSMWSTGALAMRRCDTAPPARPVVPAAAKRTSYSPSSPATGVQLNVADVFEGSA
jgi:hypothetical protein